MDNLLCHFLFLNGPNAGQVAVFANARVVIGASAACDLVLPSWEGSDVADECAEVVLMDDGSHHLYLASAQTVVFVNGRRRARNGELRSEDYIRFGFHGPELIYREGDPESNQGLPVAPEYPAASIEFISGAPKGRKETLRLDHPVRFGRKADTEVALDPREDIMVSGLHCAVEWDEQQQAFIIHDMSTNGTFLDGERVDRAAYLTDGTTVGLAETGPKFIFRDLGLTRDYPNSPSSAPLPLAQPPQLFDQELPTEEPVMDAEADWADYEEDMAVESAPQSEPRSSLPPPLPYPVPESGPGTVQFSPGEFVRDPETDSHEDSPTQFGEPAPGAKEGSSGSHRALFLDTPESKRLAAGTSGTWDRSRPIGPTVPPPLVAPRRGGSAPASRPISRLPKLSSAPLPPGKVPKVPMRINLLRSYGSRMASEPLLSSDDELNVKPWSVLVPAGVLIAALLAGTWWAVRTPSASPSTATSGPAGQLAEAVRQGKFVSSAAGKFKALVPKGWDVQESDGVLQAAAPDGSLALDVVRVTGMDAERAKAVVSSDGAVVTPGRDAQAPESTGKSHRVQVFTATSGTVDRMGLLHYPAAGGEAPALVLLEGPSDVMAGIEPGVLSELLVSGIRLEAEQPTAPSIAVAQAPTPTPLPVATPAILGTPDSSRPSPTQSSTPAVVSAPSPTPAAALRTVHLASHNLSMEVPLNWNAEADDRAGVLALDSPDGLQVRVAVDPGKLDAKAVFEALKREGWATSKTEEPADRPAYALLSRAGEHTVVAVGRRSEGKTAVLFARASRPLTGSETDVVLNLAAQAKAY